MNNLKGYLEFFAGLADLFEARFMRPQWLKYPARDSDSFDALCLFLEGYAFTRQGAKPDFAHAAADVVRELKTMAQTLTSESTPRVAWDIFRRHLQNKNLNEANNPLCPLGTPYTRKTGSAATRSNSVFEFLHALKEYNIPPNIIWYARYSIQMDKTKDVHNSLCTINGVGTKIASLFLRDVARFYVFSPSKDRVLLQPVDVWIERITDYLIRRDLSKEDVQKLILEQALINDINPEAVNEGMWYFGSEIADSEYRMQRALDDLRYAKDLIKEHAEAISQELLAWGHKQEKS